MGCINTRVKEKTPQKTLNHDSHSQSDSSVIQFSEGSIQEKYKIVRKLGQGGFGHVREVVEIATNHRRAAKTISIKNLSPSNIESILQEVNILKNLDHPGIIKIYEVYKETNSVHIITELCTGGELYEKIASQNRFSENIAAKYMFEIVSTIRYCHEAHIVHRDLKPCNILFEDSSDTARLKIIDFGMSRKFTNQKKMTKLIGTPYFIAPEVLNESYDELCDVWSIGVIMYILLCGKPPFNGTSNEEIFSKIQSEQLNFEGNVWKSISKSAKNLLKKALKKDPKDRININEFYYHPWITTRSQNLIPDKDIASKSLKNLLQFRTINNLQICTLAFLTHNFSTSEDLKQIAQLFEALDKNGDGKLSKVELTEGIKEYCGELLIYVEDIINNCDIDGNGFIEYSEFLTAAGSKKVEISKAKLHAAFKALDLDGNGKISRSELEIAIGATTSKKDMKAIMNETDLNGDGDIDIDEFTQAILKISKKKSSQ
jgi:calcium-dependent protein kinase